MKVLITGGAGFLGQRLARELLSRGELNYPYLFDLIDTLGYDGYIGCEYRPRAGTSAGLDWLKPYLNAAR